MSNKPLNLYRVLTIDMHELTLARLLHMSSSALPIGSFAYSQGMEPAVEKGWIHDGKSASQWILGLMRHQQGRWDLPIFAAMHQACANNSFKSVQRLNAMLLAARESRELRQTDEQLGYNMREILQALGAPVEILPVPVAMPTAFALASFFWNIDVRLAACAYLWHFLEQQVLCAVKLVPLGQTEGQKLLYELANEMPAIVQKALCLPKSQWGQSCPGYAIASAIHEKQYTRLYRS